MIDFEFILGVIVIGQLLWMQRTISKAVLLTTQHTEELNQQRAKAHDHANLLTVHGVHLDDHERRLNKLEP
tara:strand:+ start:396 stop:608 length:213 start_codon:yes stop_codon:yes gene_type:complete